MITGAPPLAERLPIIAQLNAAAGLVVPTPKTLTAGGNGLVKTAPNAEAQTRKTALTTAILLFLFVIFKVFWLSQLGWRPRREDRQPHPGVDELLERALESKHGVPWPVVDLVRAAAHDERRRPVKGFPADVPELTERIGLLFLRRDDNYFR